jgi:hypothetical protein
LFTDLAKQLIVVTPFEGFAIGDNAARRDAPSAGRSELNQPFCFQQLRSEQLGGLWFNT